MSLLYVYLLFVKEIVRTVHFKFYNCLTCSTLAKWPFVEMNPSERFYKWFINGKNR